MNKSIRKIYNSLKEPDKTVIFQVKNRKTLNKIIDELERMEEFYYCNLDIYRKTRLKDVYLFVGKWRLGSAGIFPYKQKDINNEYRCDSICVDWKSMPITQVEQLKTLNQIIDIFDNHKEGIKVSRKTYEDVRCDW